MESASEHAGNGHGVNFVDLVLIIGASFWVGWRSANWWLRQNIMEILEEMGFSKQERREVVRKAKEAAETIEMGEGHKRHVTLERINGIYYAHDEDTGEFMGQHENREELFKLIAKRFGNGRYAVVDNSEE